MAAWIAVCLLHTAAALPLASSGEAAPSSPARRSTRKAAAGGGDATTIPCYDPGTQELLGYLPAMSAEEVGLRSRVQPNEALQWTVGWVMCRWGEG